MTPMEFVLKWEGGYSNDPDDPGGETRWGISKRAYPSLDIASLTKEEAIAIYERDYWQKIGGDLLPPAMGLVAMNAAVNCGVSRARKWLDASGGNWREFLHLQLTHYALLRNRLFLQGWLNRTLDCWAEARKLEV